MCLVCGFVGCSRYKNKHSYDHFVDTKHTYSLELDSQKVWDYTKEAFIHRLALTEGDGKIVEVPNYRDEETMGNTLKSDFILGKDEALALEWQYLAHAQIETQRSYFEEQLKNIKRQNQLQVKKREEEINELLQEATSFTKQKEKIEHEKRVIEKKTETLRKEMAEISKETLFLRTINEALERNREGWIKKMEESELKMRNSAQEQRIRELEAQIQQLMMQIEGNKS